MTSKKDALHSSNKAGANSRCAYFFYLVRFLFRRFWILMKVVVQNIFLFNYRVHSIEI